jgi:Spy/CpxP family protein refolding chaperone
MCLLALTLFAAPVCAQQQNDPFAGNLFAPELIMQHQQALGLSEEQLDYFKNEIQRVQNYFTDLQFSLQRDMERMVELVSQDQVDERHALAVLERILNTERDIKKTQVGFLIRIKNKLTAEQQMKLREIRKKQTK